MLLGALLLQKKLIKESELEQALDIQASIGGRLGAIFVRLGVLSETSLLDVLSEQLGFKVAGVDIAIPQRSELMTLLQNCPIEKEWFLDHQIVIWENQEGLLQCTAKDLFSDTFLEMLDYFYPGRDFEQLLCTTNDLDKMLEEIRSIDEGLNWGNNDSQHLKAIAEEAPVIELVNNLITQAMEQRASDIHIEPEEKVFQVRFRIDGILYSRISLPIDKYNPVISRLKLLSSMDIAERRLPQDGRLSIRVAGMDVDIRVSSLPGTLGESMVMRLLPKERKDLSLDHLGMGEDHLQLMKQWMAEPNGIILVTGPTGSGKSTTLYAALEETNDGVRKIITVEDPVEFQLSGITQVQTHTEIGLNFSSALRSILRQDPDVIMIGEIRDLETAEIAIQSALTGHLVVSTLHTNDAMSAFTRLIDMGVEPFLVASPIKGVQAQRLVRRLCQHCAQPVQLTHEQLKGVAGSFLQEVEKVPQNWKSAVGCPKCNGLGFSGRVGIYELYPVDVELQALITAGASINEFKKRVKEQGFRTLKEDGLLKAAKGLTTIEEVLDVARH